MSTVVDTLYNDFLAIVQLMERDEAISLKSTINDNFRKVLLLCAASYFEHRLTTGLLSYCEEVTAGNTLIPTLIKNRVVSRQYHSWFNWDSNNANSFFGMFGEHFKDHMGQLIKKDADLSKAISAFLEIGRERNRLVHQDYGSFSLEKTADEIFALYRTASGFVEIIPTALRECKPAAP